MLWKQHELLTSRENKILNGSYAQELPKVVLLPDTVSIKILDTLNLTFWKLREIILLTFPQGMVLLKEPTATKPLTWFKGIFPQMITEKLTREAQRLASTKRKNQDLKFNKHWFNKERNL